MPDNPSGEPNATTASPTATALESPWVITGRFPFLTETTARSYSESRPTIVPAKTSPLFNSTSIVPPVAASSIT